MRILSIELASYHPWRLKFGNPVQLCYKDQFSPPPNTILAGRINVSRLKGRLKLQRIRHNTNYMPQSDLCDFTWKPAPLNFFNPCQTKHEMLLLTLLLLDNSVRLPAWLYSTASLNLLTALLVYEQLHFSTRLNKLTQYRLSEIALFDTCLD